MPMEVRILPAVIRLAKKAPMNTAGHIRYPSRSKAARAIPAGGQTGDALALRKASFRARCTEIKETSVKALTAVTVRIFLGVITRPPVRIAVSVTLVAHWVKRFVNNF